MIVFNGRPVMSYRFDHYIKLGVPIILGVTLVSIFLTYQLTQKERSGVGYAPNQPIPFSHQLHAGKLKVDCQYCHGGVVIGRHAGIPATNVCMNCHKFARTDSPIIQELTRRYQAGTPIPWKRIHKMPDFVYFSHNPHVTRGIDCSVCHGDVTKMDKIEQVRKLDMGDCLNCHRTAHQTLMLAGVSSPGPENCWACHR